MPGYSTGASNSAGAVQSPGRSAPVRGVASQPHQLASTAGPSNSHVASSSTSMPRQQPIHPLRWNRPYSSGLPAPAVAVPIFRAAHATDMSMSRSNDAHLPDSPPDTPPHSPGLRPVRFPTLAEFRRVSPPTLSSFSQRDVDSLTSTARDQDVSVDSLYTGETPCDTELESNGDTDISDEASDATRDQLTQAAQSLLLHHQQSKSQHQSPDSAHRNALPVELMPATPEISPDNHVRHHAQKSAHAFLHSIFANVPTNLAVEDAGVELVSPGWSGAVIKSGPATSADVSSSLSSTYSSDSSADTQRTLYVSMPAVVDASLLREQVLAVLDAASEKLGCESVMVCLDRKMRDFASVLHGLCYVGGALVAAAKANQHRQKDLATGQNKLPDTDPVSGLQLKDDLVLVAIEL